MKINFFHWLIGEILVGMVITLVSISFFQNASHHFYFYFLVILYGYPMGISYGYPSDITIR